MRQLALYAIGRDRPGIVAGVAERLLDHGANIEDSRMAILRGHFSLVLLLSAPDDVDAERLAEELAETARQLNLEWIYLNDIEDFETPPAPDHPTHVVSVYGADHPGIVVAVTRALAERDANICDLQTRLVELEDGPPLYLMVIEVACPAGASDDELSAALGAVGADQAVEVTIRRLDEDVL